MRRYLNPFVMVLTVLILSGYSYASLRLLETPLARAVLLLPFFFVWVVPVIYWTKDREDNRFIDRFLHVVSYLAMGWLSFLLAFLVLRDLGLLLVLLSGFNPLAEALADQGSAAVFILSFIALAVGLLRARRGPCLHHVDVPIEGLPADLEGFRIVQISDLHVGPTIGRAYIDHVVQETLKAAPDLIVLTGDIVDGKVIDLAPDVEPLRELTSQGKAFLVLGNHDYYSGAETWTAHFRELGWRVLLNSHELVKNQNSVLLVAGVLDPAVKLVDPLSKPDAGLALARGPASAEDPPAIRILLAHNPKIAREAAAAGFDLQLSGHTHAGQFIPWTFVVRLVHQPHYWGLSRQGRMWVYVSAVPERGDRPFAWERSLN